jgi:hypothetical protein
MELLPGNMKRRRRFRHRQAQIIKTLLNQQTGMNRILHLHGVLLP